MLSKEFPEARNALAELQSNLDVLETMEDNTERANLSNSVCERLVSLEKNINRFQVMVARENPARRELWRKRVVQLDEEATTFKFAVDKYISHIRRNQIKIQERQALLSRRRVEQSDINTSVASQQDNLRTNSSIQRSHEMIDSYIGMSNNVLSSLSSQREALKAAHKVMLDIATRLGLSRNLLTSITNRQAGDQWLVFGGMIVTLVVLILCIKWTMF